MRVACQTPLSPIARRDLGSLFQRILAGLLLGLLGLTEASLAEAADVPLTPERAALFWFKDTGTDPGFDLIALTSQEFSSAPEINRNAIRQSIVKELSTAYDAVDIADDIYMVRINARLSEYDPREGGFLSRSVRRKLAYPSQLARQSKCPWCFQRKIRAALPEQP
jgi:hypothetical protein